MNLLKGLALTAIALLFILTIDIANAPPVTFLPNDIGHFSAFYATGVSYGLAFDRWLLQLAALALAYIILECIEIQLATGHVHLKDWVMDSAPLCGALAPGWLVKMLMPRLLVSPR